MQEKRRKFLERNRKAAAKCREKKKVWITDLEQKSIMLKAENKNLQTENLKLKKTIEKLKSLYQIRTGESLPEISVSSDSESEITI